MKGFIFDLDGVIVKTDLLHYKAWKKMADSIGVYFDEEINSQLRGVSRRESLEIILKRSTVEYSEEEKVSLMKMKNDYYVTLLDTLNEEDILDGVVEIIDYLKKNGCMVAIGSSSKNTKKILSKIGLIDKFDAISDGTMIKNSKPDPEVFLLASKLINCSPENCYVVEDAVSGIQAAKNAGMKGIAISDAHHSPIADYYIDTLLDIKKIVF